MVRQGPRSGLAGEDRRGNCAAASNRDLSGCLQTNMEIRGLLCGEFAIIKGMRMCRKREDEDEDGFKFGNSTKEPQTRLHHLTDINRNAVLMTKGTMTSQECKPGH